MTTNVKGAGRKRAAAKKTKVARNEQRLEEVKHDETTGKVTRGKAKTPAKRAVPAKRATKKAAPAPKAKANGGGWDASKSLGENVDILKNGGMTWRAIAELANAQEGIEMPWPDGGKLLRARKQFLAGTEGQPTKRAARKPRAKRTEEDTQSYAETAEERYAEAIARRRVPWDEESTNEDILAMLNGRSIDFVSKITGNVTSARLVKDGRHTRIEEGKDGPYVTFASVDGPFLNISLSRIIGVG